MFLRVVGEGVKEGERGRERIFEAVFMPSREPNTGLDLTILRS